MCRNKYTIIIFFILWSFHSFCSGQVYHLWPFHSPLPENQCRYILALMHKKKWFCGTGMDSPVFNDTTWSVYLTTNSNIPDNSIKHVAFDLQGNKRGSQHKMEELVYSTEQTGQPTIPSTPASRQLYTKYHHWQPGSQMDFTDNGLSKFDGINWTTFWYYKFQITCE